MGNEGKRRLADSMRRFIDLYERSQQLPPEQQEEFATRFEQLLAAAEQGALTTDQTPATGRA